MPLKTWKCWSIATIILALGAILVNKTTLLGLGRNTPTEEGILERKSKKKIKRIRRDTISDVDCSSSDSEEFIYVPPTKEEREEKIAQRERVDKLLTDAGYDKLRPR
eukprot:GHVU01147588.1.p1 GENE.GHVU01147588.1~~GHVU01147588.1.p1  ORF type:complete len:107 (+),score=10.61 GHVU01147588.1:960-1280(+)